MHYIQEHGFAFEASQIEPNCRCLGELIIVVEEATARATSRPCQNVASVQINWKGRRLIVWCVRSGDTIDLRSILDAHI